MSSQQHDPRNRDMVIRELSRDFPREVIRKKPGAGNFDYVPAQQVIYRLNYATGGDWGFVVDAEDWDPAELLMRVRGRLWIPIVSSHPRGDVGVQRVSRSQKGLLTEELLKGAATDCLKRCARQFGVGLHLYGPNAEEELGYFLEVAEGGAPSTPSDYVTGDGARVVLDQGLVRTYHEGDTGLQVPGAVYSGPPAAMPQPAQSSQPAITPARTMNSIVDPSAVAPARTAQPGASQGPSAQPPANPSEFPRPQKPPSDNMLGRVRQEARRLGIDLESKYFQDGMVLRYGRRFDNLEAPQMSDLINTMINDPAKLNADQLGKEIQLVEPFIAEYWIARISHPSTTQAEAVEIKDAIKARYKGIDREWGQKMAEALRLKGVS